MTFTKSSTGHHSYYSERQRVLKSLVGDLEERLHALEIFDRKAEVDALADDLEYQVLLAHESALKHLLEQRNRQLGIIRIFKQTPVIFNTYQTNNSTLTENRLDSSCSVAQAGVQTSRKKPVQNSPDLISLKDELNGLRSRIASLRASELKSVHNSIEAIKARINEASFCFVKFKPNHLFPLECAPIGKIELCSASWSNSNAVPKKVELTLRYLLRPKVMEQFFLFPSSNHIISLSLGQEFSYWDLNEKKCVWKYIDWSVLVSVSTMVLLTSVFFATGHENGTIRIYIWDGSKTHSIKNLEGHENSEVNALVSLPNGRLASASAQNNLIIIWDPFLEGPRCRLLTLRQDATDTVVNSLGLLSNGYLISHSTGLDKSLIEVWNTRNGELVQHLDVFRAQMLPLVILSNDHIALASNKGDIRVYDVVEKSLVSSWNQDEPGIWDVWSMQRLRGDRLILTCDFHLKTHLKIVDASRGILLQTIRATICNGEYFIHVSPFSDTFVASHVNGLFQVWDYADSE